MLGICWDTGSAHQDVWRPGPYGEGGAIILPRFDGSMRVGPSVESASAECHQMNICFIVTKVVTKRF